MLSDVPLYSILSLLGMSVRQVNVIAGINLCPAIGLTVCLSAGMGKLRPTFSEIATSLSQYLEGFSGYTVLSREEDEEYAEDAV